MEYSTFIQQLMDAYEHLYDVVYLRNHGLVDLLTRDNWLRKEKAWHLHHLLIDIIQELSPGPQAPITSREWRRHRLMQLRYIDGLSPQSVADQLAISRRHYYRTHESAIQAIADILWQRHLASKQQAGSAVNGQAVEQQTEHQTEHQIAAETAEESAANYLELIRLESAQFAKANRQSSLKDVLDKVLMLLQDAAHQHGIVFERALPDSLPPIATNRELVRQLLLGLLGYFIQHHNHGHNLALRLTASESDGSIDFAVSPTSDTSFNKTAIPTDNEALVGVEELASLINTKLMVLTDAGTSDIMGFSALLPIFRDENTVLVIDDNDDVLELFQRYLQLHHYRLVTARNAQEGLQRAHEISPQVIILDLMMPDQDGWDLLQIFLNQPQTQGIPIVVCSVLKQKELALSLGATAFLQKPITEQALLSTLQTVLAS